MPNLDETYLRTINDYRNYLTNLQSAFNKRCEEITAQEEAKLKNTPETDLPARRQIGEEQKKLLNEALVQLKSEITQSSNKFRQKLEDIHKQRELIALDQLEA
jgi:argininosuccinate lyase